MKLALNKNLIGARAKAHAKIDAEAEIKRQSLITPGAGQALVYLQKELEVGRFFATYRGMSEAPITPTPERFPFISAEVGITAPTMWEVAGVFQGAVSTWHHASAAIEKLRIAAKKAVASASNEAAIHKASDVIWL
jgi:hypothetical protein